MVSDVIVVCNIFDLRGDIEKRKSLACVLIQLFAFVIFFSENLNLHVGLPGCRRSRQR